MAQEDVTLGSYHVNELWGHIGTFVLFSLLFYLMTEKMKHQEPADWEPEVGHQSSEAPIMDSKDNQLKL